MAKKHKILHFSTILLLCFFCKCCVGQIQFRMTKGLKFLSRYTFESQFQYTIQGDSVKFENIVLYGNDQEIDEERACILRIGIPQKLVDQATKIQFPYDTVHARIEFYFWGAEFQGYLAESISGTVQAETKSINTIEVSLDLFIVDNVGRRYRYLEKRMYTKSSRLIE